MTDEEVYKIMEGMDEVRREPLPVRPELAGQACPECGGRVEVDHTPEFNSVLPYERVCFDCGWFDAKRYATADAAEKPND